MKTTTITLGNEYWRADIWEEKGTWYYSTRYGVKGLANTTFDIAGSFHEYKINNYSEARFMLKNILKEKINPEEVQLILQGDKSF